MTSTRPATFASVMSDHDDLARRLSTLGEHPVPDDVRAQHLHAMQRAADAPEPAGPARRRFGRVAVAAGAIIGFCVGSTGFAMAGALPGPVQGVAHDVLSVVQVDVPDWRNRGECVSTAARAGDDAAKAACPKGGPPEGTPGRDGTPGREGAPGQQGKSPKPDKAPGPNRDDDPCTGKPPWASRKTAEEKAAAKATCPDRAADELHETEDEPEDDVLEGEADELDESEDPTQNRTEDQTTDQTTDQADDQPEGGIREDGNQDGGESPPPAPDAEQRPVG